MKRLRAAAWTVLALAAGCSDGPTEPAPQVNVEIRRGNTPVDEETVRPGTVITLTAGVEDQRGTPLQGRAVEWRTTEAGVATVDSRGTVTAVSTGTALIVATSGSAADTLRLNVAEPVTAALACAPGQTPLSLAVGQVHETTAREAVTLCVDGQGGSEYVLIPFHASRLEGAQQLATTFTAAGVQGVTGPPVPALLPADDARAGIAASPRDDDFHVRLRERARAGLERRLRGMQGGGVLPMRSLSAAAVPRVGDLLSLNVDTDSNDGCSSPDLRTGRVVAVTQRAIVLADTANPEPGFSDAEYARFGTEYDQLVYPVVTETFGDPSDVDENSRAIIFFTRAVNELTKQGSGFYVGGFFYDRDLFPRTGNNACAGSNEAEMLYMMVPDAVRATVEPSFAKTNVQERTLAVIGHELQHLINASRRLHVNRASVWETTWLNEGLSHVAEEVLFYRVAGLTPERNEDGSRVLSGTARSALIAYQLDNFDRFLTYLRSPDNNSPTGEDVLATRGSTWAFLRYASDRHPGTERDFWQKLVNSRTFGIANLSEAVGEDALLWMRDWSVAVYTDDAGLPVPDRFLQTSWNYRALYPRMDPFLAGSITRYPLTTRLLRADTPMELRLRGGGASYLRFGVAAGQRAAVRTTSGGLPGPEKLRLALVRTR